MVETCTFTDFFTFSAKVNRAIFFNAICKHGTDFQLHYCTFKGDNGK